MKTYTNIYPWFISLENLFLAWQTFKKGKQKKKDVLVFEYNLESNIFQLHSELKNQTYKHGPYYDFYITDPKQRHIHKAMVKDRVVHHAVFSTLNPIFEPTFIYDSYSCRLNKGTHKGINRVAKYLNKVSQNNTQPCFVLKCDIFKFFQSVNHGMLNFIIKRKIKDIQAVKLIQGIIASFNPGIPIGNLTSQLFANIYLNELDQFVKQQLKVPFYIRYTDDFIFIHNSTKQLIAWLMQIKSFLAKKLMLKLHPNKITLYKYHQGIDFLGYVQFPHHRLLRHKTKKRIIKKIHQGTSTQAMQSYLGVLSHANTHQLSEYIQNQFWFTRSDKKTPLKGV